MNRVQMPTNSESMFKFLCVKVAPILSIVVGQNLMWQKLFANLYIQTNFFLEQQTLIEINILCLCLFLCTRFILFETFSHLKEIYGFI
jgi:hypothetical protein